MALFTTTENKELEAARTQVVPTESVCPNCKSPLVLSGKTLSAFNAALGIEGHSCPQCGFVVSRRRPSMDGL
jgi:transposase